MPLIGGLEQDQPHAPLVAAQVRERWTQRCEADTLTHFLLELQCVCVRVYV